MRGTGVMASMRARTDFLMLHDDAPGSKRALVVKDPERITLRYARESIKRICASLTDKEGVVTRNWRVRGLKAAVPSGFTHWTLMLGPEFLLNKTCSGVSL